MAAPLFADYLVERRLLQRRLSFWRIAAFAAAAIGSSFLACACPAATRLSIFRRISRG